MCQCHFSFFSSQKSLLYEIALIALGSCIKWWYNHNIKAADSHSPSVWLSHFKCLTTHSWETGQNRIDSRHQWRGGEISGGVWALCTLKVLFGLRASEHRTRNLALWQKKNKNTVLLTDRNWNPFIKCIVCDETKITKCIGLDHKPCFISSWTWPLLLEEPHGALCKARDFASFLLLWDIFLHPAAQKCFTLSIGGAAPWLFCLYLNSRPCQQIIAAVLQAIWAIKYVYNVLRWDIQITRVDFAMRTSSRDSDVFDMLHRERLRSDCSSCYHFVFIRSSALLWHYMFFFSPSNHW